MGRESHGSRTHFEATSIQGTRHEFPSSPVKKGNWSLGWILREEAKIFLRLLLEISAHGQGSLKCEDGGGRGAASRGDTGDVRQGQGEGVEAEFIHFIPECRASRGP